MVQMNVFERLLAVCSELQSMAKQDGAELQLKQQKVFQSAHQIIAYVEAHCYLDMTTQQKDVEIQELAAGIICIEPKLFSPNPSAQKRAR
jgi:hypothetical protein